MLWLWHQVRATGLGLVGCCYLFGCQSMLGAVAPAKKRKEPWSPCSQYPMQARASGGGQALTTLVNHCPAKSHRGYLPTYKALFGPGYPT